MSCCTVRVWTRLIVCHFILCSAVVLVFPLPVLAGQSVTLVWNPSVDANVVGYRIHYGTVSQNYSSVVAVNNTNAATVSGLVGGTTYYFAATSVDVTGAESAFSNETSYTVPVTAATLTAPASSGTGAGKQFGFSVTGATGQSYVVQASTNLINWISLQTNTAPFAFVDVNAASFKQRFYRAYNLALYNAAMAPATLAASANTTGGTSGSGGQFSFTVTGTAGQPYVVQASTNLVNWVSLQTNAAPFVFVDTNTASFQQRFYRTFNLPP